MQSANPGVMRKLFRTYYDCPNVAGGHVRAEERGGLNLSFTSSLHRGTQRRLERKIRKGELVK